MNRAVENRATTPGRACARPGVDDSKINVASWNYIVLVVGCDVPIIVLFAALQKHFFRGVEEGSVKG